MNHYIGMDHDGSRSVSGPGRHQDDARIEVRRLNDLASRPIPRHITQTNLRPRFYVVHRTFVHQFLDEGIE